MVNQVDWLDQVHVFLGSTSVANMAVMYRLNINIMIKNNKYNDCNTFKISGYIAKTIILPSPIQCSSSRISSNVRIYYMDIHCNTPEHRFKVQLAFLKYLMFHM